MRTRIAALLGALVLIAASGTLLTGQSFAAPTADDLVIGPGAQVFADGDGNDQKFGEKHDTDPGNEDAADKNAVTSGVHNLGLRALRSNSSLIVQVGGPRLSLCSVHGPGATVDFVTEGGNTPMAQVQCGRAFGMDINLVGCTASLEFHGYIHSDRSGEIFLGMMTTDVQFQKTGPQEGRIRMTIYTPKKPIVVSGTVHSPTPIIMATCSIP